MTDGRFLVLGAGGLGCPALLGLSAAGARELAIVDCDVVDATNLHRQVLYDLGDVGAPKVEAAARRLRERVPQLRVEPISVRLDERTLSSLLAAQPAGTVVLECSDQPDLKFMVHDGCRAHGLPLVIAGVQRWGGQAMAVRHGAGACFRCVFEEAPPAELAPSCAAVGVLGAAAGALGFMMAHLAVALAEGADVAGTLVALDLRDLRPQQIRPRQRSGCAGCDPSAVPAPQRPLGPACSTSAGPACSR
ncbi:ThiF family adenylyltransferase [Nannocystis sp. SCPEA4]|uniref:HesA/MoeB/ThiF family protein n=1 Tax=Nannocystis sp. SCPEA4 TaxID=2996787 RepID=UPI00226FC4DD|nr:ThiF family adenylyltransferase [Nannocystis sp. SCPEA4]MCY1057839.1 ThiF family adenylyltransferase [Nannocystis sp. SCPEA4]